MLRNSSVTTDERLSRLPPSVKSFVEVQFQAVDKKIMSCGWPSDVIEFTLGLQHQSNSAYLYLLKLGFSLPSLSVLRRKRALCMKEAGPCPILLKLLGALASTWEPDDWYYIYINSTVGFIITFNCSLLDWLYLCSME